MSAVDLVTVPGSGAAPLTYTIAAAQEIVLRGAFGTFNGAAAASAWLPCLRILSPTGQVVGEYITDQSVAAGSSAEVSFAPFLRAAGVTAADLTGNLAFAFGDGSDGALHYDGTSTVLGMAPAAGVYTLTRDIFPTDMLVDSGVRIVNAGWRVFGIGTLTNNGQIDANGLDANFNAPAGNLSNTGYYGNRGVQGGSGTSGVGGNGSNTSTGIVLGGNGGHGGTGTGGAGGSGGLANRTSVATALLHHYFAWVLGVSPAAAAAAAWFGGAGGAGGGGSSPSGFLGGGGGGGGGVLLIGFDTIINNGTISANGGQGGSTNPLHTDAGVGGGGGGGGIGVFTNSFTGNAPTANGGLIGSVGTTTGATAGVNGTVTFIVAA